MSEEKQGEATQTWAVIELMGHRQAIGAISETVIAGRQMLTVVRVDTEPEGQVQHYGPESVYCLTPVTEEQARLIASQRYKTHVVPPALMAGLDVGGEDDEVWDFTEEDA